MLKQDDKINKEHDDDLIFQKKTYLFRYRYASGELGFTFFLIFIAYYLMFFMTDVLIIPVSTAAIIYTTLQWLEGLTMILAGILIDRILLKKGRFHPWITYGSLMCFSFLILTFLDYNMSTVWTVIFFTLFYCLMYMGFNLTWVAYRASLGILSHSKQDSIYLTTGASQLGSIAGFLFSLIGVKLLYSFENIQHGFIASALVYGLILVICMWVVTVLVKPFDAISIDISSPKQIRVPIKDILKTINKPLVTLFSAVAFRESVNSLLAVLLAYYFAYSVGDILWMGYFIGISTLFSFIGKLMAATVLKYLDKKLVFIYSALISVVCLVMLNFHIGSLLWFMTWMAIRAFFSVFSGVMLPVFITDIAKYNAYKYGNQAKAFVFSIGGLAINVAAIIGGAIATFGLVIIGYESGQIMTDKMAVNITLLMTMGGSIVYLISCVIFAFYKLDNHLMDDIYKKHNK